MTPDEAKKKTIQMIRERGPLYPDDIIFQFIIDSCPKTMWDAIRLARESFWAIVHHDYIGYIDSKWRLGLNKSYLESVDNGN